MRIKLKGGYIISENYKQHVERVKKMFDEKKDLFADKNSNYGCSYIKAGEILELLLGGRELKLKTHKDHIAYQIITRKLDKLVRYVNLRFGGEVDKVGEKCAETMADDGVYSLMLAEMDSDLEDVKQEEKATEKPEKKAAPKPKKKDEKKDEKKEEDDDDLLGDLNL